MTHAESKAGRSATDTGAGSSRPVRVVMHGARGRMGARILACAADDPAFRVVAALDHGDAAAWRAARGGHRRADVVVDFSSDAGAREAALVASEEPCPLLVGTTGLTAETMAALERAAERAAVMVAPNTSLGVAVARRLVADAARMLGRGWDADIIEWHHHHKKDAPSGTALALADAAASGGHPIPRQRIAAVRAGDIIGEHVVMFAGPGEILEVRHRATTRDVFALGALRLAAWLAERPAGMHSIESWLGGRA